MTTYISVHNTTSVYVSELNGSNNSHWRTIVIDDVEGNRTEVTMFLPNGTDQLLIRSDNGLLNEEG